MACGVMKPVRIATMPPTGTVTGNMENSQINLSNYTTQPNNPSTSQIGYWMTLQMAGAPRANSHATPSFSQAIMFQFSSTHLGLNSIITVAIL